MKNKWFNVVDMFLYVVFIVLFLIYRFNINSSIKNAFYVWAAFTIVFNVYSYIKLKYTKSIINILFSIASSDISIYFL